MRPCDIPSKIIVQLRRIRKSREWVIIINLEDSKRHLKLHYEILISKLHYEIVNIYENNKFNLYIRPQYMNELTKLIQDEVLLCILFVEDIVLVDKTRHGVANEL